MTITETGAPAGTRSAGPTYSGYLRLPQLLDLRTHSPAGSRDELLFVTVHQAQELWFAQLLAELTGVRDHLFEGDTRSARAGMDRALSIGEVLLTGLRPLRHLRPAQFHAFRAGLGSASGAQSSQFREIEVVCGAPWTRETPLPEGLSAGERIRMERLSTEPTVWDAFVALIRKAGFDTETRESRSVAFARFAADPLGDGPSDILELAELSEALLRWDELWAEWRAGHVLLVERQIGGMPGTGGSTGMAHLRAGMHRRFFPELWENRATGIR
ncbi:tryptophan 2,3-dioxygenase family protein [Streptomyces sp. CAU 1734]|uniref:tryptophan 2,3-dioxygenase family protein n=1 Tax=Streptomyces sp. CAU 1734 TaxID=3140360 RepID=UPI0032608680